ncbi:MAG: macro domain-containing protein [Blastocatellia bacterium]|nr:macro domain-containing protein [Blastocatellia bacterium]
MKLHLIDLDPLLVAAWQTAFANFPEVEIQAADILEVAHTCVVSPANSYGFMDGGIDLAYRDFFGARIEKKVQDHIALRPEGLLPVGASLLVRTGNDRIPYLLVAPTMELPGPVGFQNCYHAMVAVLRIAHKSAELVPDVFCPGLGTGCGRVAPEMAASEMAAAYRDWVTRLNVANRPAS